MRKVRSSSLNLCFRKLEQWNYNTFHICFCKIHFVADYPSSKWVWKRLKSSDNFVQFTLFCNLYFCIFYEICFSRLIVKRSYETSCNPPDTIANYRHCIIILSYWRNNIFGWFGKAFFLGKVLNTEKPLQTKQNLCFPKSSSLWVSKVLQNWMPS